MILYADTSALVKNYVREAGSDQVVSFFAQCPVIGTSALTEVEMAAAMAKAARLGWVEETAIRSVWQDFHTHWTSYARLPATGGILERSTTLIWKHGLRAYDAVHLASALVWQEALMENVVFACFDKFLSRAASAEGLQVWPENEG